MTLNLERVSDQPAQANNSALDHIRGLYRKAEGERRLTLRLPGEIGKHVKIRYRPLDDFEPSDANATPNTLVLDFLIASCDGILTRSGAEWVPLLDEDGDPVTFDSGQLSDMFALGVPPVEEGGTVRQVVLEAFRGAPSREDAAAEHATRITTWLKTGQSRLDEEEFLGES